LAVRPSASFANTSNGRETRNQTHIGANAPQRLSPGVKPRSLLR